VHAASDRARVYREKVEGSPEYRELKRAMNLWCGCWFWPAGEIAHAPLPTTLAAPLAETLKVVDHLSRRKRFFHWEVEFPDVFNDERSGFDAILGNPPWETLQPNSKEFFSNVDPLYRSYGKQEALRYQTDYFANDEVEGRWLDYAAGFANDANWMKFASSPFGDPQADGDGETFAISRGRVNLGSHDRWRAARSRTAGFADPSHPFQHRGEGKAYTYKLFLEQAHALLAPNGRLGFVVPSGLYSDHGTGALRRLLLDRCRWEWLFGFENRDKIFDIHRSFKFNPIIVEKGGETRAIRTAFMRRRLEDWESAEALMTPYSREQVDRFSPKSKAILEIQSRRDLKILEKIYANSVLLGDNGPDGWGITYAQGDFNMTSDSKLFPPRPKWEAEGYRPDEYSRWIKGDWRPIEELWRELDVDPSRVVPIDSECERRIAAPDVQLTEWRPRCAQPPYDTLPIPRADIPTGFILSREGDAWVKQDGIEDLALPLYQGVMMNRLEFTSKTWVSGTGLTAKWDPSDHSLQTVGPQFLMNAADAAEAALREKCVFRDIARSTDERTCIPAAIPAFPCGNILGVLSSKRAAPAIAAVVASLAFDWALRQRIGGTHLNWYVAEELPILPYVAENGRLLELLGARLSAVSTLFHGTWGQIARSSNSAGSFRNRWQVTAHERLRGLVVNDAVVASLFGLGLDDVTTMLLWCDLPTDQLGRGELEPKGFWRVDKEKDPELRHTVLTLVAFADLEQQIRAAGGDREKGIESFLAQNDGEGWMLPETLRIADYGLGHDERAKHPQPVASRLGPRFCDWQLAQTAEESWRECEIHARNLSGTAPEGEPPLSGRRTMADPDLDRGHDSSTQAVGRGQPVLFPGEGKE
jgi:hypothetical protein